MAVVGCPVQDESYKKLESYVGKFAAVRQWMRFRELGFENAQGEALKQFDVNQFKIEDKLRLLIDQGNRITFEEEAHKYSIGGKELDSVSRRLDAFAELRYEGTSVGQEYADSGTAVHTVANLIANGVSEESVRRYMSDTGIPADVYSQLFNFIDKLKATGVVLSEEKLADPESDTAGMSDIVHLKFDGTIDVYDFKTASWTKYHRTHNKKPWSPVESFKGYKAKRYTSQLEAYSRMIEKTSGQSVSNKYIVPIEIEFEDDTVQKGFKNVVLHPSENVKDYGFELLAAEVNDQIFNQVSSAVEVPVLKSVDDSTAFIQELTGHIQGVVTNAEAEAKFILDTKSTTRGGLKGYVAGNVFRQFRNQTDQRAQVQQIIDEYIAFRQNASHNVEYSVKNFIETGNDAYLESLGSKSEQLKRFLSIFKGRKLNIYNLNKIKGLENKLNWIVLQEGDNYHLAYIGSDNLRQEFQTPRFGPKSLFGNFVSTLEARENLKSTLDNNFADARKLEGGFIAMKLKEAIPTAKFGFTGVYSVYDGGPYSETFSLKEVLGTISAIAKHPAFRATFPPNTKDIATNPELTDFKNYQQDFASLLMSYVTQVKEHSIRDNIIEGTRNYAKDASNKQALMSMLERDINKRREIGNDSPVDYETYLMSAMYFQLKDVFVDLTPIKSTAAKISMGQNQANQILQSVNLAVNNAINSLARKFWADYKDPFVKAQSALFKSKATPVASYLRDVTIGDTVRYYDNLYEKKNFRVKKEDGTESTVSLPTFNLIQEGTPEFTKLTEPEQKMITLVNNTIEKFTAENRIQWVRGRLPLVKGELGNLLFNAIARGDSTGYQDIINKALANFEDNFGAGDFKGTSSGNIFASQTNTPEDDSRRENILGITTEGYVNMEKYREMSTNLEVMMDVFAIQNLRWETFNTASATAKAADAVFQWSKSNLLAERLGANIEWVQGFNEAMVNNRDIDSGDVKNKLTRAWQKVTSLTLLGLRPSTALISYLGQEMTIFSQSVANSFSGDMGFGWKHYIKARGIVTMALAKKAGSRETYDKINLLMRDMRLFNQDLSSHLNGYHRMGDKTLFRTKFAYGMMNAVDWASRAHILVGQMLADGTWDAYTVVDDQLIYDTTKDSRFTSDKYSTDEKNALRKYLESSFGVEPGGHLPSGYDEAMSNSIRGRANYLIGGFDRETRAMMNFQWWGKLFMTFKNWLPAKVDRWLKRPFQSQMIGSLTFERNKEGVLEAIWKGDQMEGIIYSLLSGYHYTLKTIQAMRGDATALETRNPLTAVQKNNIIRFASDLVMIAGAMMFYANFPDDDDDTVWDDFTALSVRRAADDLLVMYNLMQGDSFFWTPVSVEYYLQVQNIILKGVTGEEPENLLKIVPVARQMEEYYLILNGEKMP